ncbi:MAG TPA: cyclic nucleotide-binding domain-containing protein, partial [Bryobacteraceae bacterium]|nr:cyclic nucleotide-binding domain-containing protein [Bryobacteraceae bacterium]
MFPKLDDVQIARLAPFGRKIDTQAGEVVVEQGDSHRGVFVVLSGGLELLAVSAAGESRLRLLSRGEFNGEVNMLSGRRSLVRLRTPEASTLFEIDRAHLRQIMQTDAELGETFLNAFIMRRVYLIAHSLGDAVLVGSSHSSDTLRLREFLTRNGHP